MDLGNKIKNIRYNYNISQEEMAKILQVNRNYLSRIETNKSLPTAEVLARLAEEFNVSIDSLLGINLDGKEGEEIKLKKIKKISQYCNYLSNSELDFVINMLCVMSNHSKYN
jgi:transcriptional regulator with XRE-family HTH domain